MVVVDWLLWLWFWSFVGFLCVCVCFSWWFDWQWWIGMWVFYVCVFLLSGLAGGSNGLRKREIGERGRIKNNKERIFK